MSHTPKRHNVILNSTDRCILQCITKGMTNYEISQEVKLSPDSMVTTLTRLYRKIGARNKHHAAAMAVQKDYSFNPLDRFKGVPMKITRLNPVRSRKIKECPELW